MRDSRPQFALHIGESDANTKRVSSPAPNVPYPSRRTFEIGVALLVCLYAGLHPARGDSSRWGGNGVARLPSSNSLSRDDQPPRVRVGIDVLKNRRFEPLKGRRIGLITNHTGIDHNRCSTIDALAKAPGLKLVALFSPEHGIRGTEDDIVQSGTDQRTGLPIHSLYGKSRRPTDRMLQGIDAFVFDIQDIGTRFYTYISTMGYCMEAAARHRIPFYVLDRPNPIGGIRVEGPVMDQNMISFTGYHTMPNRHGMTVGELAMMFNAEKKFGCSLYVVAMSGWTRNLRWEETGCPWINTSPNMRSPDEAVLYPGIGALECTNLSVGRGTDRPFEIVGAPWIKGRRLADWLQSRQLPGVRFRAHVFTPDSSVYKGKRCEGVFIEVMDRRQVNSVRCGLELAHALCRLHPRHFEVKSYASMIGQGWVVDRLRSGVDPEEIETEWEPSRREFLRRRARFLIYPDPSQTDGDPAPSRRLGGWRVPR